MLQQIYAQLGTGGPSKIGQEDDKIMDKKSYCRIGDKWTPEKSDRRMTE
jgi:hypothetical protein